MAYFELLDRDAVLGNLERARDLIHRYLAGEAEGPPSTLLEEAGEDGLTPDELGALAGEMSESLAYHTQSDANPDAVFLPRDGVVSSFQAGVERHAADLEAPGSRTALGAAAQLFGPELLAGQGPLPAVTDRHLPLPAERAERSFTGPEPGSFKPWPDDYLWGGVIAEALAHRLKHGIRPFNPNPAMCQLESNARIILLSDWGTGIERVVWLSSKIRGLLQSPGLPTHVIHLGDIYYAGWPWECEDRGLIAWPVPDRKPELANSWDLNGNHDMYSGGFGYFDTILRDHRFSHQCDQAGEPTSIFRLENEDWLILGLDTAWQGNRLRRADDGAMEPGQVAWIEEAIKGAGGRKVVLLSHHQLFSAFANPTMLENKLGQFLKGNRVHAWFWGHEHVCTIYRPQVHSGVSYARCVGNGGVPTYLPPPVAANHPLVERNFDLSYSRQYRGRDLLQFGFVILEFDGPDLRASYIPEEDDAAWHSESLPPIP